MNPQNIAAGEPVIEAVSDHIHRLELPLPLDGLEVVNCYVIVGTSEITLIDPGWSTAIGEAALLAGLDALGLSRSDVQRTLATHGHPDHFTLAAQWQRDYDIPLHLGALEKPSILAYSVESARFPHQADLLVCAGMPELAERIRFLEQLDYERDMTWCPASVWVEDQELIDCGGPVIRVHSLPGHTRGHVVYEDVASGSLFTGDHVLPRVTPAIGLELVPEESPLTNYLASLEALLQRPDGAMLPAHGSVTVSTQQRAQELLHHHDERFGVVQSHIASGKSTAGEVAAAMTWTRRERRLADLDPVHQMTAIVETLYHLDVLADRGELRRASQAGVSVFTPA